MIYGVVPIIFIMIMEYLCVVCAIECIMAAFQKPKLWKLELMVTITKALPFRIQCSLVPLLDSLTLVLAHMLLEIFVSLISGFVFLLYFNSL